MRRRWRCSSPRRRGRTGASLDPHQVRPRGALRWWAMTAIRNSLSAHHDVMDALVAEALAAARAARWPEYRLRFAELRRALIEHMTYEDEALFPALAREIGDAEVAPLRMQHERLQQHFETLASAAAEHDPEGCVAEMEALAALLRAHHEHEQRVCYPRSARADAAPPAF